MNKMTSSSLPPSNEYTPITSLDISLLLAFLSIWLTAYYYTVLSPWGKPDAFGTSTFISNLHSIPLCLLALLSIQQIIPECVPRCYSISFFIVDLLDSIVRCEYMWLLHAVISLVLNVATGWNARHCALRSVSKGFFAEGSTVSVFCVCRHHCYDSFLMYVSVR